MSHMEPSETEQGNIPQMLQNYKGQLFSESQCNFVLRLVKAT